MKFTSDLELAIFLSDAMPSIGFCSVTKKINAFNFICHLGEKVCKDNNGDTDFERLMPALMVLTHINKNFLKSALMVSVNLHRMSAGDLNRSGYYIADAYNNKM